MRLLLWFAIGAGCFAATVPFDSPQWKAGAVGLSSTADEIAVTANGWKWVRFGVWDVAGNGAFGNPIWRKK